jgi:hypothetical protein
MIRAPDRPTVENDRWFPDHPNAKFQDHPNAKEH